MQRPSLAIFLLFFLVPFLGFSQRTVQSINSSWQFHKGAGEPTGREDRESGAYWQDVGIPHTWNAEDVMDDAMGYHRGVCWYQKAVFVPSEWDQKQIYVHFEGVSQTAEVFVNGKSAGTHTGGYTAFRFNITEQLQQGKNLLWVRVDNSLDFDISPVGGDFSIYGGIYRDVQLIAVDQNHFDMDNHASSGLFVSTPQVSAETASVLVRGKVAARRNVRVVTVLYDAEGNKTAETSSIPHRDGSFSADIKNIKNPRLWHPDDPYLYRIVHTLADAEQGTVFDEITNPMGFRWYSFDPDRGFILNGKPFKLMGANRHQDFKGLGPALPDALHVNDIQLLKDMGGNFIRISHYPQDPAIMEACDRLGILASVETPPSGDGRANENESYARTVLNMQREMIRQNHNHPCVIIWSYMNEVALARPPYEAGTAEREQYWRTVRDLAAKLEKLSREEDPERYTMIACHGDLDLYEHIGLIDIPMVVGWNLYQGWYVGVFEDFETFVLDFRKAYPSTPFMISEYGADSDYRLHSFAPSRFDKTQEWATRFHEAYLETIHKYPFIAGGAVWCLVDFVNAFREEATPHMNTKGLMTADRQPKDAYYLYKAWLAKDPFVKIAGADWPHRAQTADEGDDAIATQPITIYSNQRSVSLWANGGPLGAQHVLNGKAVYPVRFKNGINTLRALAEDGSEDLLSVRFHVVANDLRSKENPFTSLNISFGDRRMFMDDLTQETWLPEQAYRPGSWGYVGGRVHTDFKGEYNADRYGSPRNILGTPYDAVYQTQRVGLSAFRADVPDGVYEVTFHFAELLTDQQRERLLSDLGNNSGGNASSGKDTEKRDFDVVINNTIFLKNLSPENHLIPLQAYSTKTKVTVKDGKGIYVRFVAHGGEPVLNGIQLKKTY